MINKLDLAKQYQKMINGEIGYEHYFINYYLYFPFSQYQEEIAIYETLKIMNNLKILNLESVEHLETFLNKLQKWYIAIKKSNDMDKKEIKKLLSIPNERRVNLNTKELLTYQKYFPKFSKHGIYDKEIYDENNASINSIIYGDYINRNQNVEVYLHQRTMKKVKYKKREYDSLHPFNNTLAKFQKNKNELFDKIIRESSEFLNETTEKQLNNVKSFFK